MEITKISQGFEIAVMFKISELAEIARSTEMPEPDK